MSKKIDFRFEEDDTIRELYDYVASTYNAHYSGKKNLQATDLIIDAGHGTGFCVGNIIKYAKRYGKKGDGEQAKKDVMKILHYALILAYVHKVDYEGEDIGTTEDVQVVTGGESTITSNRLEEILRGELERLHAHATTYTVAEDLGTIDPNSWASIRESNKKAFEDPVEWSAQIGEHDVAKAAERMKILDKIPKRSGGIERLWVGDVDEEKKS